MLDIFEAVMTRNGLDARIVDREYKPFGPRKEDVRLLVVVTLPNSTEVVRTYTRSGVVVDFGVDKNYDLVNRPKAKWRNIYADSLKGRHEIDWSSKQSAIQIARNAPAGQWLGTLEIQQTGHIVFHKAKE